VALLGTSAYIATRPSAEPVEASTAALLDPNDPLSALTPQALHQATAHLQLVGLGDLLRQYVVYLGSSQAALVESGPWVLKKVEWARDNVPVLGSAVWGFFSIVSSPCSLLPKSDSLIAPSHALRRR
jgi:proline dehydrogenase